MTAEEFAEVASLLEAAFGHALTPQQHQVWFGMLGALPGQAVRQATVAICRHWPHDRRPWVSDLYQRAQEFIRPAPAVARVLPEPSREPLRAEARALLAQMGTGGEPGPNAVSIDAAVEIIAEKIRGSSTRALTAREIYGPTGVMAAIVGRGPHADLWLALRHRPSQRAMP